MTAGPMAAGPMATLEAEAALSLSTHGRTFAWASRAFGSDVARRVALLYGFCRRLDDLVDEKPREEARAALGVVRRDLERGRSPHDPWVEAFLRMSERHAIDGSIPNQLLRGFESDLRSVRIDSEDALIRYAYRVAGTVGLMMNRVLDVSSVEADPFAIDLGIALQLTNIARDVVEDAGRDRVYLPRPWLASGVGPDALIRPRLRTRVETRVAIHRLLDLADRYYRSADRGLAYLPTRSRLAVVTAARVYEAIGPQIRRQRDGAWGERAVVDGTTRLRETARAIGQWIGTVLAPGDRPDHDPALHAALRGLPGVDPRS